MEILYEDNHLIAINKINSDIVQGDKTGDEPLSEKVKKYLKEKYNKPGAVFLGVPHRLDRPVSGVVLFAKTSKALSRLNVMFQNQEIKKTYWAIVRQKPPHREGQLEHFLVRNEKLNRTFAYDEPVNDSKKAILSYKILANSDYYYLLEVHLKTGRHHQIRCQLAKIGSPIKGDLKYGYPRSDKNGGISLHARKIEFVHPVSNQLIQITAPVPQDDNLWLYFENLQENK
ncbi:MAG TPA: RluA family pseudouridine synthase [Paludibacteraceae bacterium]|nr:RluA family pseudouridine synthase [Paludibacteraceae bacterium]HOL00088.1 RluA family pseudouridine synthase [Paludibacteraceae bacterium]HPO66973.1 RluA family pseudouridine synthase [Paludibacteraceae bacterium]